MKWGARRIYWGAKRTYKTNCGPSLARSIFSREPSECHRFAAEQTNELNQARAAAWLDMLGNETRGIRLKERNKPVALSELTSTPSKAKKNTHTHSLNVPLYSPPWARTRAPVSTQTCNRFSKTNQNAADISVRVREAQRFRSRLQRILTRSSHLHPAKEKLIYR